MSYLVDIKRTCTKAIFSSCLLWCAMGCSRSEGTGKESGARAFQFTKMTEGLQAVHRDGVPLFEKVSCIPPRTRPGIPYCNTSRVYRDGTFYMLGQSEAGEPTSWRVITSISQEGVAQIEDVFAQVCKEVDPVLGNDSGSVLYRVNSPRCNREIVITGVPDGKLSRLEEIQGIMSRTGRTIPPSPKP